VEVKETGRGANAAGVRSNRVAHVGGAAQGAKWGGEHEMTETGYLVPIGCGKRRQRQTALYKIPGTDVVPMWYSFGMILQAHAALLVAADGSTSPGLSRPIRARKSPARDPSRCSDELLGNRHQSRCSLRGLPGAVAGDAKDESCQVVGR
jgi:hypothetical protein